MTMRFQIVSNSAAKALASDQPEGRHNNSPLKRATELLISSSRIGHQRSHYDEYIRYVLLNSQDIFNALVELYAALFMSHIYDFGRFLKSFQIPPGVEPQVYMARCYISHWFVDLYVTNRNVVKKNLSTIEFNKHFSYIIPHQSTKYDAYLALLNASLRPTHVKLALEDALYIPYIAEHINWEDKNQNYFGITGFFINEPMFRGTIQIMMDKSKKWIFSSITDDTLGHRPCWLFDWHNEASICAAWFHMEGNFNLDDVTIAYILGVACSPNLAPRDVDDWQPLGPNNVVPDNPKRVYPRRFYGSYEVREYDIEIPKKRFRIVDYTYYYLVVLNKDDHTRSRALKMIVSVDEF